MTTPKLAYRMRDGKPVLIYNEDSQGNPKLLQYGEEECNCCDDCCHSINGGDFNQAGNLVFETAIVSIEIQMPTPNSRQVCNADRLILTITRKAPFDIGSSFLFFYWLDRDWLYFDHSPAGSDQHEGANFRVWESTSPSATMEIEWTKCYLNYVQDYGDIVFGTIITAGMEIPGEAIEITFTENEIPEGMDCCEYNPICDPCAFILSDIGDPIGPEVTREGRTYWRDDPSGWSIKAVVTGCTPEEEHRFYREDAIATEILYSGTRPPKDEYYNFADWTFEICFQHVNWKDGSGAQSHPLYPMLDPAEPATECYPGAFSENSDPCYEITRFPEETEAMKYGFEATVPECVWECPEEDRYSVIPDDLTISVTVTSESPEVSLELEIQVDECESDETCCRTCLPCCSNACLIDADEIDDCDQEDLEDLVVSGPASVSGLSWSVYRYVSESMIYEWMYDIEQVADSEIQLKCVDLTDQQGECDDDIPHRTVGCYFKVPCEVTDARNSSPDLTSLIGQSIGMSLFPPLYGDPGDSGYNPTHADKWFASTGVLGGMMYGGHANETDCGATSLSWTKGPNETATWDTIAENTDGSASVSGVSAIPEGCSCTGTGIGDTDGILIDDETDEPCRPEDIE